MFLSLFKIKLLYGVKKTNGVWRGYQPGGGSWPSTQIYTDSNTGNSCYYYYMDPVGGNKDDFMLMVYGDLIYVPADSSKSYWLHDEDLGGENFSSITNSSQFYINADGRLVIVFAEGEVAPMFMGEQEFVMPESIWK